MKLITLNVNGQAVQKAVSDRTHLGDFLRDTVQLTGTHLGCEHGVCGACTVLLDGAPIRSCITFAVACEGHSITTIEGYEQDPVMRRLRLAFSVHHALQCGYCTPGMLATARDIILRLPQADEQRVRIELAGNLCRCTGYQGIVAAILAVLNDVRVTPDIQVDRLRAAAAQGVSIQPPRSVASSDVVSVEAKRSTPIEGFSSPAVEKVTAPIAIQAVPTSQSVQGDKGTRVAASFDVPFDIESVWALMSDLTAVAGCLPGAQIDSQTPERVAGNIAVKFGPMAATFKGHATIERDASAHTATLKGNGQDSLSQSRATGDVQYRLEALEVSHTRVLVTLVYTLQGPLAQFSRSGLVQEFVRRMVTDFGQNVTQRLSQPDTPMPSQARPLNPLRVLLSILWGKIKKLASR